VGFLRKILHSNLEQSTDCENYNNRMTGDLVAVALKFMKLKESSREYWGMNPFTIWMNTTGVLSYITSFTQIVLKELSKLNNGFLKIQGNIFHSHPEKTFGFGCRASYVRQVLH
jgi:hypothetical protein